jgi:hypothetical protein
MSRLLCIILLLVALLAPPASAQTFGPPLQTERVLVLLDREGNTHFTFSFRSAITPHPRSTTL